MTNDLFGQDPVKGAAGDALETREHVDILIIGGGLAGLSAGLRAMELGCRSILIIDKTSGEGQDWGGCSLVAGGSFLIPVSRAEQDVKAYAAAIYEKGLKKGRTDLIETMAEHAWDALDWMVAQGVKYTKPVSVFPASPEVLTAVTAMKTAMPVLRDKYRGAGGRLVYGTKAMRLELDASGVCGALVQGPDDLFYRIVAKKTLLCTGGYAANKQFLADHMGEMGEDIMCRAPACATGDGIYLAQAVGGYTITASGPRSVHLSAVDPVFKERGQPGNAIPYMIAVNSEGRRFMDEALGSVRHGQAVSRQSVARDALLFDSKVCEQVSTTMQKLHNEGVKTWKADTIEEMAGYFGVDPVALVDTVNYFNAHVNVQQERTEGLKFNKSAKALPIDTPPYYGIYPLVPGTSLTFGGLATTTKAEVQQADGRMVPNLYAAGEGTGGFFFDDYFGGSCMTRAVVFGHIAVESALAGI